MPKILFHHADPTKSLSLVSPFLVDKVLKTHLPEGVTSVRKLRNGALLVGVSSHEGSERLLQLDWFGNIPVTATLQFLTNRVKGKIRSWELEGLSVEELEKSLHEQNVIAVQRLHGNSARKDSPPCYVLTFNGDAIPVKISVAYSYIPVEPYLPQALRCFSCQRYGHKALNCSRPQICPRCAAPTGGDHRPGSCDAPAKCAKLRRSP